MNKFNFCISSIVIILFVSSIYVFCSDTSSVSKTNSLCVPCSYKVVQSRAKVRIILIPKACRNEKFLRELGSKIKDDFQSQPNIIVNVFDELNAAKMYDELIAAGGSLGKEKDKYYDKHYVAVYNKFSNNHENLYVITLEGYNGHQIEINY
jgi:hypothetical protein